MSRIIGIYSKNWLRRGKTRRIFPHPHRGYQREWVSFDGRHSHREAYYGAGFGNCPDQHIRVK